MKIKLKSFVDIITDQNRRDLTINSMSMTFDGDLIDPYNGAADLRNKIVRFVGNPEIRIKEDALRILRFLRFHGRFSQGKPLNNEAMKAIIRNAEGLKGISRERVWMEMAKIVTGNDAKYLVRNIYDMHLAEMIGLPNGDVNRLQRHTKNPVTLMTSMLGAEIEGLTQEWKWSAEERDLALFLSKFINKTTDFFYTDTNYKRLVAHDGFSKEWVSELALMHNNKVFATSVRDWEVPTFPVKGVDLIKAGIKPGPQMGEKLREMKKAWADSFYSRTKDSLMKMI
jgi:tRNA nucleotidyltransferase (CCA-adding enzyme)